MRTALLIAGSAALFLLAAKAHGRELRIEREVAGVAHVVFGGVNPPIVEAIWRAERVRFWIATPALAAALAALLALRGVSSGKLALAAVAWAPSIAFAGLGVWSIARAGGLARTGLAGSAGWWALVALAAAATATLARAPVR